MNSRNGKEKHVSHVISNNSNRTRQEKKTGNFYDHYRAA
jgi:hypothetical protein